MLLLICYIITLRTKIEVNIIEMGCMCLRKYQILGSVNNVSHFCFRSLSFGLVPPVLLNIPLLEVIQWPSLRRRPRSTAAWAKRAGQCCRRHERSELGIDTFSAHAIRLQTTA